MSEGTCYQARVEMVRAEPLPNDRLEDLAEAVLDALNGNARMLAFGPVVSVDFAKTAVEVEFTVLGETAQDVNRKVGRVANVVQTAVSKCDPGFAYNASRTDRVPA